METIKEDSKKYSNNTLDIDNLRSRYIEKNYLDYEEQVAVEFPAFDLYVLEKNFFQLAAESDLVPFKQVWTNRPSYVSEEYYGTPIFWPIILFVNRIHSMEDFTNLDSILVPPIQVIHDFVDDKKNIPDRLLELEKVSKVSSDLMYYQIYPLDDAEISKLRSQQTLQQYPVELGGKTPDEIETVPTVDPWDLDVDGGIF